MSNNIITRESDTFNDVTFNNEDERMSDDHTYYAYGVRAYTTDDYAAVVRDGEYVLAPRLSEDEARTWWDDNEWLVTKINNAVRRADYAEQRTEQYRTALSNSNNDNTAMRVAFERALTVVAEKGRDYARDNELCENYERFLMLGVNREAVRISDPYLLDNYGSEVHGDDSEVGNYYRNYMRRFVRFATRTRKAVVIVGKQHSAYLTRNDVSSAVLGPEVHDYYRDTHYSVKGEQMVMSYDECVKANEYAIRNGWAYAANAFGESADNEEC